jgi:hypothetical protein
MVDDLWCLRSDGKPWSIGTSSRARFRGSTYIYIWVVSSWVPFSWHNNGRLSWMIT